MKIFRIILPILALAVVASCVSKEPENNQGSNLSELQIYYGADSFEANAGETISIPFSIAGVEGKTLSLKAEVDNELASTNIVNDATYAGNIRFTAPVVMPSTGNVKVTLMAEDKANNRSTSADINVKVAASEAFGIAWTGDVKSVALKSGGSFRLLFSISGASEEAVVLSTPTATVGSGFSASVEMISKTEGYVIVKADGAPNSSVSVKVSVADNFNRQSEVSVNLEVVPVVNTSGASNCYIVKPGETVAINAKVQGGSSDPVEFDYACLVWQDARNLVSSVAGSSEDGVIVVKTNLSVTGNAVVAAVKGADIVWSWHLWIVDYDPMAQPLVYTNQTTGVEYVMMDRNLGARTNLAGSADCFGLHYQWGRKDPFVGARSVDEIAFAPKYDIDNNTLLMKTYSFKASSLAAGETNLDYAIKNPDTFITPVPVDGLNFTDWYSLSALDQDSDLWGGKSKYKTKYDPCPEGWRVSPSAAWTFRKLYKKDGKLTDDSRYDETYPWHWDYVTDAGFYYNDSEKGVKYFFPMCGEINNQSGNLQGVGGGAQYATPEPDRSYCMTELFAFGNPASESGLRRDYGQSIRCVREYEYQ